MAKKPRSAVMDYLVYVAVRCFVCVVQALPWQVTYSLARGLAWFAYRVDKRHRLVALQNLRLAFPHQYSEAELERMVLDVYHHFCTLVLDIIMLPRKLHVNNHHILFRHTDDGMVVDSILSDRPLLIVTCHFGNWEAAGYALGQFGFSTYAVARALDNPYLDRFLGKFRERTGQTLLDKNDDFDLMTKILAEGGVIATLADQDAGQRGQFVDFFGRPASTHKAIALLALEYQVPIIVSVTRKVADPLRFEIVTAEKILPEDYADRPDAVAAITKRFTNALEQLIRQAPAQYLWLHNRWKHQPIAKVRKRAA